MKSDRAAAELLLAAVLPSLKIINKQHLILHYIVLSIHQDILNVSKNINGIGENRLYCLNG